MTLMQTLAGKQIVICVTGSIAAVETVRLIHALRRRGAVVQAVMSPAATEILHPHALAYASGRGVITHLSGAVEHITWCGDGGTADLLLIAPCTANTIGKIACGIDDTAVTTFATTAIGSKKPIVIVPAMHHSMYRHPGVVANLQHLREWGLEIVDPRIDEGKAKMADPEEIVLNVERAVMGRPLAGRRVLITSGSCREPVDDIRVLTTRAGGEMGRALALQAFRLGAGVTVVHRDRFPCVQNLSAETAEEMREQVMGFLSGNGADVYLSAAAISDFAPRRVKGKIPSGRTVDLVLHPLPKVLPDVLENYRPVTVAFKLGEGAEEMAAALLEQGAEMVLANDAETMGSSQGEYLLITRDGKRPLSGPKDEIAAEIWKALLLRSPFARTEPGHGDEGGAFR